MAKVPVTTVHGRPNNAFIVIIVTIIITSPVLFFFFLFFLFLTCLLYTVATFKFYSAASSLSRLAFLVACRCLLLFCIRMDVIAANKF